METLSNKEYEQMMEDEKKDLVMNDLKPSTKHFAGMYCFCS